MEQQERSKMLGSMQVGKLVVKVSVPIMISMLVQALYNIVDGIFVARYSADALTAVSLAFPIQMLMIAASTGLGVGINSLISRKLGAKRAEEAREAARNGIFLQLCAYALFLIFGVCFAKTFFKLFTPVPELQELGGQYLSIVCTLSFGLFMSITFERMMQATGNTVLSMLTQLSGAVINIILDPIFIFGLLGFPAMGVAGAALATVIGQIAGMLIGLCLNQTRNRELKISVRGFQPNAHILRSILAVGFPSIIMQSISSVMNVTMNLILMGFGNTAVSVLGVYFKLQSFVFMPIFGLSNGLVAIIGYNYGARLRSRIYGSIRFALKLAAVIMGVGMLAFLLIPQVLLSLFESGEASELTALGVVALRTICFHFPMAAVGITLSTVFQAVGKGFYSLVMSLCRQLLVLLPAAWILSRLGGLNAIWWSFTIAEFVSLVLCLCFYRRVDRTLFKSLEE